MLDGSQTCCPIECFLLALMLELVPFGIVRRKTRCEPSQVFTRFEQNPCYQGYIVNRRQSTIHNDFGFDTQLWHPKKTCYFLVPASEQLFGFQTLFLFKMLRVIQNQETIQHRFHVDGKGLRGRVHKAERLEKRHWSCAFSPVGHLLLQTLSPHSEQLKKDADEKNAPVDTGQTTWVELSSKNFRSLLAKLSVPTAQSLKAPPTLCSVSLSAQLRFHPAPLILLTTYSENRNSKKNSVSSVGRLGRPTSRRSLVQSSCCLHVEVSLSKILNPKLNVWMWVPDEQVGSL